MKGGDVEAQSEKTPLLHDQADTTRRTLHSDLAPFVLSGLASVVLITLGVCAGVYLEGLKPVTAFYVVVQIVTTIGYGDFTPSARGMKVFVSFYALLCLILVAYFLSIIQKKILEAQAALMQRRVKESIGDGAPSGRETRSVDEIEEARVREAAVNASLKFFGMILLGTVFYRTYEACSCSFGLSRVEGCRAPNFETCVATGGYVKTWADSFYMCVITLTTIGFGDYTPMSPWGRFLGCIWMIVGVGTAANFIDKISQLFFHADSGDAGDGRLASDQILNDVIKRGNGDVTRSDYLAYVLVSHDLVAKDVIDEVNAQFDKIDAQRKDSIPIDRVKSSSRKASRPALGARLGAGLMGACSHA